jgi:hypothetical protein
MKVMMSAIKSCKQTSHKYGVEVPRSLNHARELDKKNGNTLWMAAWKKEMTNVSIVFEILEDREPARWTSPEKQDESRMTTNQLTR